MAYCFGDSFDCYATMADPIAGYWDSGIGVGGTNTLVAGRFAGSQAVSVISGPIVHLVKSSAVNDAVHHISVAFRQTAALSGTTLGTYFQFTDVSVNQCCIVFRSDGVILLTSATPAGTVLATYNAAVTAANTWFQFEFEVIISNTVGRFRARKNGNTVDDFDSGATLNTRPGANSYANKLSLGMNTNVNAQQYDDLLWRSDASSVAWAGDIRAYTRMPASDASTQFARAPASAVVSLGLSSSATNTGGQARYSPIVASYDGTISTATVSMLTGYTGNMKCALFTNAGGVPTTVLGSATPIANPISGTSTFTFGTPIAVTKGTQYWLGFDSDTTSGSYQTPSGSIGLSSTTPYAAFPAAFPGTGSLTAAVTCSVTITLTSNATLVNETLQDGTTSYVYDSTPGNADFYTIGSIASTPVNIVAVTVRGFMAKSDAGARTGTVQLKSGGTTVAAPTNNLSTSFGWVYRTDSTDPNTGSAWTAVAVNGAQIGPKTVA